MTAVVAAPAAGRPEVWLLDARAADVDADGLRAWARAQTAPCGAAYVTRSYRHPYALVAWHDEPVGVDVERIAPCDGAFADLVCTPSERAGAARAADADAHLTALWSSKEALAKALGDALLYDPHRLESPLGWPGLRSGPWRAAPLAVAPGHVGWVTWRAAGATASTAPGR